MKKLILSAALLLSVATFAQKEELKTLKKIYAKETISEKDLETYKATSDALQSLASDESDKVYAKFYKTMYPTVVLASKGAKATVQDQIKLYNPEFIKEYRSTIDETIEFEKKLGKKIYTEELINEKNQFIENLSALAMKFNNSSNFKEASAAFYSLYIFDQQNQGKALQNAAILAVQSKDYKLSAKLYEEFYNSDYFNNGMHYYATNKASEMEEDLVSKSNRTKSIALGLYEKPRDERVNKIKPEVLKILSILHNQNEDFVKAKQIYSEARLLLPEDEELKNGEYNIYFNEGVALLINETKLVQEINDSRSDKKKYDELVEKRKFMFQSALPLFEKAYSIIPTNEDTKNILKIAYEITGQPEKAKAIK